MADENLMEETGNQHLNTNTVVVAASAIAVESNVNDDILQEAFGGSEDFDQEYAVQTDTDDVSQSVVQQQINDVTDTEIDGTTLDSTTQIVAQSNGFGTETYRVVNALPDGTISIPDELIVQAVAPEGTVQIDETESGVTLVDHNGDHHHVIENQQVLEGQPVFENQQCILEGQDQVLEDQQQALNNQDQVLEGRQVTLLPPQQELQENIQTVDQEQSGQEEAIIVQQPRHQGYQFTLVQPGNQSGAPLGSSQNPIRIIQQGNSYTPLQELPPEQMAQIMQVVHTQQVARNTHEAGGSVVINPRNNTQVMYRVIYPSELHKGQQTLLQVTPKGTTVSSVPVKETTIQLPKRPYRKRGKDDEEDKMDGPEMSKEEKEERKKHRPRTRSGRVSKPPKHMVKDYKHIHVLDWDEDYDDSDGGYSDYKGSDEEGGRGKDKESSAELSSGLAMNSARPKNHKCHTCEKSYIGQAGLARHFRLNPSHGSLPAGAEDDADMADIGMLTASEENSPPVVLMNNGATILTATFPTPTSINTDPPPISLVSGVVGSSSVAAGSNVGSSMGNLSEEDSNTQDSIPSSSGAISPITTRTPRPRGRGGHRGRGRWMYHHHTAPARKKQKLKELIKTIENEDLMEVVLPRLVKFVSLWEFMLMKVETCNSVHPRADHIYQEFLALHKHVRQVCQEGLVAEAVAGKVKVTPQQEQNGVDTEDSLENHYPVLQMADEAIAKSLGLASGSYEVKDLPVNEYTSFRYKYLTSDPNGPPGVTAEKRTIQVVSQDELVYQSPNKRSKTTPSSLLNCSTPATVVSLGDSATAASSLLTSIVSNSGLTGAGHKPQQTLFRTVAVQQPQSSLLQTVRVQQPSTSLLPVQQARSVVPAMTLPPQQSTTAILRTVNVPSQPQTPTVLRTVTMPSQSQTSLLRIQQPVVASAGKQSNGTGGVMGVSLLNNSRTAVISQHPSVAVLKSPAGQSSHILVAAPGSLSVTGPNNVSEIPQSQAAQVVSLLPSGIHTPSLSLPSLTTGPMVTDFNPMGPEDFMDNSDDSLVSSVSGLSSANSSGLVSAHSSLPNGDMTEVGFSNVVKVNGVSAKSDGLSPEKESMSLVNDGSYINTPSLQEDSEQLPVTSAMESTSATTSLFIKCENGELYTIASTGETVPLTSASADCVLASTEAMPSSSSGVNGLFNSSHLEDSVVVKEEKDSLAEDQGVLLADESVVMNQEDPLHQGTDVDMEVDDSVETSSFTLHQNATLFQTEDGTIIIQNPDGTSFQLQGTGDQGLTLESVQELLSQMVSGEQVQTEVQQ
ncbi:hypothetical protein ACOMHN_019743 [Nucella lapillus]